MKCISNDFFFKKTTSYSNVLFDDSLKSFRMILSNNLRTCYYSFFENDVVEDNRSWHYTICKKCVEWREWKCHVCNKCKYFNNLITSTALSCLLKCTH